jgi:T4 superinfection immunity protein
MFLDSTANTSSDGGSTALAIFLVVMYFLPIFVAYGRGKVNAGGVVIVNVFLGWTVLGWIVALAMAASGTTKKQQAQAAPPRPVQIQAAPPPQVQISPDGKFWWDGQQWQPMPSSAPPSS